MSVYSNRFWTSSHRYEGLVKQYERNIEITHPPATTSDGICKWCYHCAWGANNVTYYEYTGPKL